MSSVKPYAIETNNCHTMLNRYYLTKSEYCRGITCPKILWMDCHKPEASLPRDSVQTLEQGIQVGKAAQGYFGDCNVVDYCPHKEIMCRQTQRLMDSGAPTIAEASFMADGLFCAVDLLHKNGNRWDIIEVKSSTGKKPVYIDDIAFQYHVLNQCGINVKKVCLLYIDNSYILHGELDLQGLFVLEDCTEECIEAAEDVMKNVDNLRSYLSTNREPFKDLDVCCLDQAPCDYWEYCSRHLPAYSVFDLKNTTKKKKCDLYHQGIISFEDILENRPKLNKNQMQQVETEYYKYRDQINIAKIREFVDQLRYPIYHLDFETIQPAIPIYEGCCPYKQIPFQYSLHIEEENGKLQHKEYLAPEGSDPRRGLAEALCRDIPESSFCMAYNMRFEKSVLKDLAGWYPDLSDQLLAIHDNMYDLMIPFQKRYYYNREMKGSYSIKYVLPALFPEEPELDYRNLEGIHMGTEASAAFADLPNHSPEEIAVIRSQLLKYCRLDTLAMVKVLGRLKEVGRESDSIIRM